MTTLYATFWRCTAGARGLLAAFLGLLFMAQLLRLVIPWFFGQAVNALQDSAAQDLRTALLYMGLTLGATVAAWVLHGPGRVMERFVAVRARARFADTLYARLTALPLGWHERHHSGETIQRMGKATLALFGFAQHQFIYLQNLISVVGPIAALFVVSTATGLTALAGYAAILALLVRFDRTMVHLLEEENRAERRYMAELVDCLGNIATVLTLRLQAATRRVVGDRLAEVFVPLRRSVVVNEAKWCAIDLANNALRTGLVVLYAWLAWRDGGVVPLGTAVMVHQYAQQIGGVVGSMATHWSDLVRHSADIAGADAILEAQPRAGAEAAPVAADWRAVRVRGLDFRYGDRMALQGLELDLVRGGRVALIGESGSGKSTLLRVLAGLYEAERVAIAVDGVERPDLRDLGAIATLVPQDPEIFESSIRQNITMGIDYPPEEVLRACRLAQLLPVVERLPLGLDTVITERGLNLSGGQKQRLALARGILASRASGLIMLDEPTSSMDPTTELTVYQALLDEFPDACIVSAVHRLHLLKHFDRVVLMADGRRVDSGTLDELLARQPAFQAMWRNYHGVPAAA